MVTELAVKGMTCNNCVKHVREALESLDGVERADVSLEQAYASVHHNASVSTETLIQAVQEEGYEVSFRDQRGQSA